MYFKGETNKDRGQSRHSFEGTNVFPTCKVSKIVCIEEFFRAIYRVANHVTSDDRVHGISENKLLNSGNIFLDIFVNTCQN